MKQSFAAALFVFVVLVWAPTGWGQQTSPFHCVLATQLEKKVTYYSSDVIHIHNDVVEARALAAAWDSYVRANFPIGNPQDKGSCEFLGYADDHPGYASAWERGYEKFGATAIHVNWTCTSAPSATPAAPPSHPATMQPRAPAPVTPAHPAAPAPQPAASNVTPPAHVQPPVSAQSKAYHCIFDTHQVRYSGGPIQTDAAIASLNDAWKNEVRAAFHINEPGAHGGCQPISAAPAYRDRAVSSYEENSKRMGIQTVHVNWTSAPGQVTAASSPPPAPAHAIAAPASAPAPAAPPAHATTAIATPAPAPQPSALAQHPEASRLAEPFRTRALNEASGQKQYCQNEPMLSGMFDCDCYAKMILHQRVAHASEYRVVQNPQDDGGWEPLQNLFIGDKLPCTECISDARLSKYASAEAHKSLSIVIANHSISDAGVKNTMDCTAQKFVAGFHARPYIGAIEVIYRESFIVCSK